MSNLLGFWGLLVLPGKTYSQVVSDSFRLSNAALGADAKPGRTTVNVKVDRNDYALCSLTTEKIEQQTLDLTFTEGEKIVFYVTGDSPVHLTGNYLPPLEDPYGFDDEDEMDDGEDLDDEDEDDLDDEEDLDDDDEDDDDDDDDEEFDEEEYERILQQHLKKNKKGGAKIKELDENGNEVDDEEDEEDDDFELDDEDIEDDEEDDEDEEDEDDDDDEEEEEAKPKPQQKKPEAKANGKEDKKRPLPADNANNNNKKQKTEEAPKAQQAKENKDTNGQASQAKEGNKKENKQSNGKETPQQKTPQQKKDGKPETAATPGSESKKRTLPSGLVIEDVKASQGKKIHKGQTAIMRYVGRLQNGTVFDSNLSGQPFKFKLGAGEVIKGWDIGVDGMTVGSERKLTIPAALAYGSKGAPPSIPKNATLEFEIKLLGIQGK